MTAYSWAAQISASVTAWKLSIFRVFLVHIFQHSDWIYRDTPYLLVFTPNAGKYWPEKLRIRTLFTQCVSIFKSPFLSLSWTIPIFICSLSHFSHMLTYIPYNFLFFHLLFSSFCKAPYKVLVFLVFLFITFNSSLSQSITPPLN